MSFVQIQVKVFVKKKIDSFEKSQFKNMKEGGTDRGELTLWKLIQPYTIIRGELCHPRHYSITHYTSSQSGQCRVTIKVNSYHHAASELISIDQISHFDALSYIPFPLLMSGGQ